MIGRVLAGRPRDSFVIATKVWEDVKFADLLDLSLKRLGLEYVDILYVHGLAARDSVLKEINLKNVEAAKKSGKVRFVGVSTHKNEAEVLRAAVEAKVYDVVLTAYNFRQKGLADLQQAIHEAVGGRDRDRGHEDPGRRLLGQGAEGPHQHDGGPEVGAEQSRHHDRHPGLHDLRPAQDRRRRPDRHHADRKPRRRT